MIEIDNEKLNGIYQKALYRYGIDMQTMICIEEMGELMQALSKNKRGKPNNMGEEIADVLITVMQVAIGYGLKEDVETWMKIKSRMLEERLEK